MHSSAAQDALRDAMACHQRNELFDAELHYARALQLDPNNARAWRLRGLLHRDRGDVATALRHLNRACELAPGNPEPLADTGMTLLLAGDLQAAEDALRGARALAPNAIDTLTNLGALLQHRGHLLEAAELYREILAQDEQEIEIRCNLAKALSDAGRRDAALAEADRAVALGGGRRGALATRGAVLLDHDDYAGAAVALAAAVDLEPDDMALVNLAVCATAGDDRRAAREYLQQAVELNPHNARAVADLVNVCSAAGAHEIALDLATDFLKTHPAERLVLSNYALALAASGDAAQAMALTDCRQLVQVFDLPAPDGFNDITAFNAALASELRNDPSLIANPVSKATTGGAQTGELNLGKSPALQAFSTLMHAAVEAAAATYRERGLATHPVMQPAGDNFALRAWGTLINAGGRQTPHMHPLGWLSAVYYVSLPEDMDAMGSAAGWLEFGRPPARIYSAVPPETTRYEPKTGRLIVFPSWFWHCTLPFTAAAPRVSIAFDAMPTRRLRAL